VKKFSAHYIFPLASAPLKNGILVIDENGFVQELVDTGGQIRETDRFEFHSGVLLPEINGLTMEKLRNRQEEMPQKLLEEILRSLLPEGNCGFAPGQKAGVYLLYPLDMANLRLTAKSKLKKLV
jgi:hypothetical protein